MEKKLFLLDAMALIYRAHFAFSKNPRVNSKGMNTGAVLGFTHALVEILQKEKPTHLGVAFDTNAPTFRHEMMESYKANRQEQPEDIQISIPYVKRVVEAFQVQSIELNGFEADDIIGTLSRKAYDEGYTVYMMTPDKDFGQLVNERVFLYKPSYMGNSVEVQGVPEILARWNVERVEQVVDMLGLQGDAVDNIPGIPGIGPKTASKLLAKYGSVEKLIENVEDLKGKQKQNVIEFAEQGLLSKKLAKIDTNVPVDFDPEALKWNTWHEEQLREVFAELEFKTLTRRLLGEDTSAAPKAGDQLSLLSTGQQQKTSAAVPQEVEKTQPDTIASRLHHYHLVESEEACKELLHYLMLQKSVCFDTETTSVDAATAELVGIAFCYQSGSAYYLPLPEEHDEVLKLLNIFEPFFSSENIEKVGQNLRYDLTVLQQYGVEVKGPLFDTMLAHYLLEPDLRHNMDYLAETYLNYKPVSITELIGKKGKNQLNMRQVAPEQVKEYAAEDADITWQLAEVMRSKLKEQPRLQEILHELELPLMEVLASMEANGIAIDKAALDAYSIELGERLAEIEKEIYKQAEVEFNIGSPKQLGEVLFDKLKLLEKPRKTRTGQYATGEEILVQLTEKHEIVPLILQYRQLSKLKSTYVDALPALLSPTDGLIHTSYNQAVAATGRLSSTNPNLQNIPIRTEEGRQIRAAFVPRSEEFTLLSADYSQIELRIMASLSKDETMIEAFKNKKDIHAATAAKIFKIDLGEVDSEMRRRAKTANFGIIYGISAFGLAQRLNIPRGEAGDLIKAYFEEFPAVKAYMDKVVEDARKTEFVETVMGRRRYLRDINSRNQTQRGFAERNAINAPIQGSAADVIKKAMIDVHQWLQKEKLQTLMLLQVHDELVFDVHRSELELVQPKIMQLMEQAATLEVPLEVESGVGENWLVAH
jgi:DNA polymerase-1